MRLGSTKTPRLRPGTATAAAPPPRRVGRPARLAGTALLAMMVGQILAIAAVPTDAAAQGGDIEQVRTIIAGIKQRTKTRQISGGENLNVMEWTTEDGSDATMDGAVVYFKKFASAFGYFNDRFTEFTGDLPKEWEDYGNYQQQAREISGGDINVVNRMIVDLFEWFKPKQRMIGNQGGVLIIFGRDGAGARMVAYADPNKYKDNNVAGVLTGQSYLNRIRLDGDVFRLLPGAGEFIRVILEDQGGVVRIEVPYILYNIPRR
jgi:hypothetical protein